MLSSDDEREKLLNAKIEILKEMPNGSIVEVIDELHEDVNDVD